MRKEKVLGFMLQGFMASCLAFLVYREVTRKPEPEHECGCGCCHEDVEDGREEKAGTEDDDEDIMQYIIK